MRSACPSVLTRPRPTSEVSPIYISTLKRTHNPDISTVSFHRRQSEGGAFFSSPVMAMELTATKLYKVAVPWAREHILRPGFNARTYLFHGPLSRRLSR